MVTLYKVINNSIRAHIINSNIVEYNIERAYPMILSSIDNKYEYLLDLTKNEYIEEINTIFTTNRDIRKKVEAKTIDIYNEWLKRNKILQGNFIATTTDSIIICNQIAPINQIDGFVFRNKDKVSYTSLFSINPTTYILFDRVTKRMKIQGKFNDPFVSTYPFVTKILKDVCCVCNEFTYETRNESLKKLAKLRTKYLCSEDKTIYADILNQGHYKYNVNGSMVYTPSLYPSEDDCNLVIEDNYINFMLPLIQSLL